MVCVYDNDEPTPGVVTALPTSASSAVLSPSSLPMETQGTLGTPGAGTVLSKDSVVPRQTKGATKGGQSKGQTQSKSQPEIVTGVMESTDPPAKSSAAKNARSESIPDSSLSVSPVLKKIKTSQGTSAAIRPSPLRTSVTTDATDVLSLASPLSSERTSVTETGSKRKASFSNGSTPSSQVEVEDGDEAEDDEDDDGDAKTDQRETSDANDGGTLMPALLCYETRE